MLSVNRVPASSRASPAPSRSHQAGPSGIPRPSTIASWYVWCVPGARQPSGRSASQKTASRWSKLVSGASPSAATVEGGSAREGRYAAAIPTVPSAAARARVSRARAGLPNAAPAGRPIAALATTVPTTRPSHALPRPPDGPRHPRGLLRVHDEGEESAGEQRRQPRGTRNGKRGDGELDRQRGQERNRREGRDTHAEGEKRQEDQDVLGGKDRSEERRVGKECPQLCRS